MLDRRLFLAYCSTLGLGSTLFPGALYAKAQAEGEITTEAIAAAEQIAGLTFTEAQREMMVEDLNERLEDYAAMRAVALPNSVRPALVFDPRVSGMLPPSGESHLAWTSPPIQRPADDETLAFLTVAELASLVKSRQVTATELTELYLARLKKYDPVLQAVVTLTEDRAREQASRADAEISAGNWRGPLHGIPYGAKDLLAVRGYKTTWGAMPYRDQVIDTDAAVVEKLEAAGAVLVAKLTLGALAWGDVWYDGTTKNPWNIEEGSSGSSAGPGAAVAAGLVGFALGSETLGSIVSPSTRNGVTGHRPTFGTVSKYGAMALSWSMDKLGPMARAAEDCALIYHAIHGQDARDPSTLSVPFAYDAGRDVTGLRVGFLEAAFSEDYDNREADAQTLAVLRGLGIEPVPMKLPDDLPVGAMLLVLEVEAAAAFDELTRTGGTDLMVRQEKNAWPHVFRTARMVPAVEYVQANRLRTLLMQRMVEVMRDVDVFVTPSFGGGSLRITNLTGHPSITVPNAFHPLEDAAGAARRRPASISFVGGLYQDADVLALAAAYQHATDFHRQRPPIR